MTIPTITKMVKVYVDAATVERLKRENFVEKDGRVYLNYTPHKTENSSARVVKWPVHELIWRQIRDREYDFTEDTFRELNRQMRGLGFAGTKGAYELRKICVDHIYQKYGAEMATSISGDDIKTIIRYYALLCYMPMNIRRDGRCRTVRIRWTPCRTSRERV